MMVGRGGKRGKVWAAWLLAGLFVSGALSSCSNGDGASAGGTAGESGQAGESVASGNGGTHLASAGNSSNSTEAGGPSGGSTMVPPGDAQGGSSEGGRNGGSLDGGGASSDPTGGASGASAGGTSSELGFGGAVSLSPGECFVDGECAAAASGTCTGGNTAKICEHRRDACLEHDDCDDGEYCDDYCKPAAAKNKACSPGNRCAAGLACQAGVCVEGHLDCSAPYYEGQKIVYPVNTSCPSGSACLDIDYHRCDAAVNIGPPDCACWDVGGLHRLCPLDGNLDLGTYAARQLGGCDPGLTCKHEDMEYSRGYCEPRSGVGELCGETAENHNSGWGRDNVCLEGLYCGLTVQDLSDIGPNEQPEDRCVPAPAGGKACAIPDPDGFCEPGQVCRETSWRCLPSPSEGQPCLDPSVCGGNCLAGWCTDQHDCSRCAAGLECRSGTCQRLADYGRSCDTHSCAPGLNCVEARVGGQCSTGP
jgi:hypothetical protein